MVRGHVPWHRICDRPLGWHSPKGVTKHPACFSTVTGTRAIALRPLAGKCAPVLKKQQGPRPRHRAAHVCAIDASMQSDQRHKQNWMMMIVISGWWTVSRCNTFGSGWRRRRQAGGGAAAHGEPTRALSDKQRGPARLTLRVHLERATVIDPHASRCLPSHSCVVHKRSTDVGPSGAPGAAAGCPADVEADGLPHTSGVPGTAGAAGHAHWGPRIGRPGAVPAVRERSVRRAVRTRVRRCPPPPQCILACSQQQHQQGGLAQKLACVGAAAMLTLGSLGGAPSALANEFDILGEPQPTNNYFVDDANVLSKATRSDLNKKLSYLEVRCGRRSKRAAVVLPHGHVCGWDRACRSPEAHDSQRRRWHCTPGCCPSAIGARFPMLAHFAGLPDDPTQIQSGIRVQVVTVRKLEFETDAFAFADKVRCLSGQGCARVLHPCMVDPANVCIAYACADWVGAALVCAGVWVGVGGWGCGAVQGGAVRRGGRDWAG